MERQRLPARRRGFNEKFRWNGYAVFISTGYYEDGRLGEVFLSAGKLQSGLDTAAKDTAIAISLALQHGCTVETLDHAFLRQDNGDPEGLAGAALRFILKNGLDKIDPLEPMPAGFDPDPPPLPPVSSALAVELEPEKTDV